MHRWHRSTTGERGMAACLMQDACIAAQMYPRACVDTCRGASAAAVVYDITNAESFQKAKHWVSELQKNASGNIGKFWLLPCSRPWFLLRLHLSAVRCAVIILVANKSDLTEQREVTEETGREYAERCGAYVSVLAAVSHAHGELTLACCMPQELNALH